MSNFSVEHLQKCISEKDQYKFTQQYLKEVELQNQGVYDIVNEVLIDMLTTNKFQPTAKLFALRFFKDLIISAQFQLIDSLHESIIKQIVKVSQFDKQNTQKLKRGSSYFEKVQKRKKEPELQKVSYSYVLLATEIIYVLGNWHAEDQNDEETDYVFIFKKLKNSKVPFPANDKELKFFKLQEKQLFIKNYKEWLKKLPEIEEQSNQEDKSNLHESKKPITSLSSTLQVKKPQKQQLSIKSTKDNKADNSLRLQFEKLIKENETLKKRIQELQKNLQQSDSSLKTFQKQNQQFKQKHSTLETKISQLESKCMLLETQFAESQKKLKESQLIAQKLNVESQQQRLLVTKISMQSTDKEEKLSRSLKQSQNQLNEAQQKIGRLEREIQQIHTIKNSYKNIMDDPHKLTSQNNQPLQQKIRELEKQMEEIAEFNTKQQIQFKEQVQALKRQNQTLEKDIEEKNLLIGKLQSQLNSKTSQNNYVEINPNLILPLQSSPKAKETFNRNETKKPPANFFNFQPQLKIQFEEKPSNSMSQFLLSQTTFFKKTIESKENSYDTLKSKQSQHYYAKSRNSLGKTEKSLEKRKGIPNRTSNGKTFHFSNLDPNKPNDLNQNNLQRRHFLGLGRDNNNTCSNVVIPQKDQQIFSNKKSALTLNRKRQLQEQQISKHNGVQTLIPYIPNYFPQNQQFNWLFKSLCLFSEARNKQSIFKNDVIQVKLLNDYKNKSSYLFGVTNLSHGPIKVQVVSCHDQFKIIGQKSCLIHPNSFSQYRIETRVKDLNLRYPVMSLIVSGMANNKGANFTQNVALPLTMLEFTEMREEIPDFCNQERQKLGMLNSQRFSLNKSYPSLRQCFPRLSFQINQRSLIRSKNVRQEYWQGRLHHSFIQNVDVYMKMLECQGQVSLQYWYLSMDKISQNYSKVMIQTLMFLLQ